MNCGRQGNLRVKNEVLVCLKRVLSVVKLRGHVYVTIIKLRQNICMSIYMYISNLYCKRFFNQGNPELQGMLLV